MKHTADTAPVTRHERQRRLRDHTQAVGALAAMSAMLLSGCAVTPNEKPEVVTMVAIGNPLSPDVFQDMTVISIDNPDDGIEPGLSDAYLSKTYRDSIASISQTLDNDIIVPKDVIVKPIVLTPDGKDDNGEPCYDDEKIVKYRNAIVPRKLDAPIPATPIVIQSDTRTCTYVEKSAIAYAPADLPGGVFFPSTFYRDQVAVEATIKHELGHTPGNLSHSGVIAKGGNRNTLLSTLSPELDASKAVSSGEFSLVERFDSNQKKMIVDGYANNQTVMGRNHYSTPGGEDYSFVEKNQLDPGSSRIQQISTTEPGVYRLNADEGGLRGVTFALNKKHPLRNMPFDGKFTSISIGLNSSHGDELSEVAVIARQDDGFTASFDTVSFIPAFDYTHEPGGDVTIFEDEEVGIRVSAISPYDVKFDKNAAVDLHVEMIDSK